MAKSKSTKGKQTAGGSRQSKAKPNVTAQKSERVTASKSVHLDSDDFAFGKINYIIMLGGLLLIIIGYALMAGGNSSTPEEFNPEIFSFQRITLAPMMVLAGLIVQVWAIVKKAD